MARRRSTTACFRIDAGHQPPYGRFLIETFDLYAQSVYSGFPVSVQSFDNWIGMVLGYPPENCGLSGRCGHYFVIEADGSVYPWDFYALDQWRLGNIRETSLFRLDKSPLAVAFRKASLPLPADCEACPYHPLCRGGCKRDREPILDGSPSRNRLCAGHKLFFDARINPLCRLARYMAQK